jgi:hypothetical protein
MSRAAAGAPAPPPIPQLEPPAAAAAAAAPVAGCQSKLNYSSVFMPPEAVQTFRLAVTGTRNYTCLTQALQFGPAMALSRGVGDGLHCECGGVGGRCPPAVLSICALLAACRYSRGVCWRTVWIAPPAPTRKALHCAYLQVWATTPPPTLATCTAAMLSAESMWARSLWTQRCRGQVGAYQLGKEGGCCQLQHWYAPFSCLAAIAICAKNRPLPPHPTPCRAVFVLPAPDSGVSEPWGRFKVTKDGKLPRSNYVVRYNTTGGVSAGGCWCAG